MPAGIANEVQVTTPVEVALEQLEVEAVKSVHEAEGSKTVVEAVRREKVLVAPAGVELVSVQDKFPIILVGSAVSYTDEIKFPEVEYWE